MQSSDIPLISVVIPAFNAIDFIGQAIDSIYNQGCNSLEVIVVDDGSTDGTSTAVRKLYPSVRIIEQKNSGPSGARNTGIKKAKGEFIAFLDADDVWVKGTFQSRIQALKNIGGLGLVASDMAEINFDGDLMVPSMLARHGMLKTIKEFKGKPIPYALSMLLKKNFIPTGTVVVNKKIIENIGYFREDIRFGEDLDLWARIAYSYPIVCLPEVHMLRRIHEKNTTRNNHPMLKDLSRVMLSVDSWARPYLLKQGINSRKYVARALWNLGYADFNEGDFLAARKSFYLGFVKTGNFKLLIYSSFTFFPRQALRLFRALKIKFFPKLF